MTVLRDYQSRATHAVRARWQDGCRSVCLVAPTGSGKTVMGADLTHGTRALWIAHRRELVGQALHRVGCEVASIQELLHRPASGWPAAELLVLDEAHHYRADQWGEVANHYRAARVLGLTATPERADGRALGDVFQGLIVAASYSELVAAGHLVPCDVWCSPEATGSGAVATGALAAYQQHGDRWRAFVFCRGVEDARQSARDWTEAGIPSAVVSATTPAQERDAALAAFRAGDLHALHNVSVLTEGVDVPDASVVVLARPLSHASQYLQIAGRVLRPAPGKSRAILIDLCGSALTHGSPTEDRLYSLDGQPIRRSESAPTLHQCLACGWTWEGASSACPTCGYEPPVRERPPVRVYSLELQRLDDLRDATPEQRVREVQRLISICREHGWRVSWAAREYRRLFGEPVPPRTMLDETTPEERTAELAAVRDLAAKKGWKPGYASVMYKELFGSWPARG